MELGHIRSKTSLANLFILILSGSLFACQGMPSESDARVWYETHSQALDEIEASLREAITQLPRFTGEPPTCPDVAEGSDYIGQLVAETNCMNERSEWIQAAIDEEQRFQYEVVPAVLSYPYLVGLEVNLTSLRPNLYDPTASPPTLYIREGNDTANKRGSIHPRDGIRVDQRQVGWGLGQTHCEHDSQAFGDTDYHRQLDVLWEFTHENTRVEVAVHLLGDEIPSDQWRENCLYPHR